MACLGHLQLQPARYSVARRPITIHDPVPGGAIISRNISRESSRKPNMLVLRVLDELVEELWQPRDVKSTPRQSAVITTTRDRYDLLAKVTVRKRSPASSVLADALP